MFQPDGRFLGQHRLNIGLGILRVHGIERSDDTVRRRRREPLGEVRYCWLAMEIVTSSIQTSPDPVIAKVTVSGPSRGDMR